MQMLCKCNPNAKELQSKCTAYAMQMLCKIMQIKLNKTKLNIKYKYKICLLVWPHAPARKVGPSSEKIMLKSHFWKRLLEQVAHADSS